MKASGAPHRAPTKLTKLSNKLAPHMATVARNAMQHIRNKFFRHFRASGGLVLGSKKGLSRRRTAGKSMTGMVQKIAEINMTLSTVFVAPSRRLMSTMVATPSW
mmetsp:Transcript_54445/g.151686  ORF Transcript_54445/g.151686 Transcript_54445/m.151686 type:complete len:104 (+) Transcript_54445:370-681(+)